MIFFSRILFHEGSSTYQMLFKASAHFFFFRMRDVAGQMAVDKQELTKENERLKDELASLTKMCEKVKKDLDAYENIIAELRERVSDFMF